MENLDSQTNPTSQRQLLRTGASQWWSKPTPYSHTLQVVPMDTANPGSPSPSYLLFSIGVCLFCCWPIGVAAIMSAVRTNEENGRRNWVAAKRSSRKALNYSIASLVCGSVVIILLIALRVTGHIEKDDHGYYG